jgi:hypothetical protein
VARKRGSGISIFLKMGKSENQNSRKKFSLNFIHECVAESQSARRKIEQMSWRKS